MFLDPRTLSSNLSRAPHNSASPLHANAYANEIWSLVGLPQQPPPQMCFSLSFLKWEPPTWKCWWSILSVRRGQIVLNKLHYTVFLPVSSRYNIHKWFLPMRLWGDPQQFETELTFPAKVYASDCVFESLCTRSCVRKSMLLCFMCFNLTFRWPFFSLIHSAFSTKT